MELSNSAESNTSGVNNVKNNPETERAGMPWSKEENEELMNHVANGLTVEQIAKYHKRTMGGIQARMVFNAWMLVQDQKMDVEQACEHARVSLEEYSQFCEKREKRKEKRRQARQASRQEAKNTRQLQKTEKSDQLENTNDANNSDKKYTNLMNLLIEIRDLLKK
jgi:hypothetical protein